MPRGRSADDSTTGTSSRRRRSRSPLRAVSKKSKSILGNITGGTKKKKSAVPELSFEEAAAKITAKTATAAPAKAESAPGDDETEYGVVLDKGAKALPTPATPPRKDAAPAKAATPGSAKKSSGAAAASGPALQVVLLLMDPKTRRFELLQLEFEAEKAVVADVLTQISLSATEQSLRTQKYTGVADRTGASKEKTVVLSSFCSANDIILAIPEGMTASECSKLARPILGDPKVNTMLHPTGTNLSPVKEEAKGGERSAEKSSSGGVVATLVSLFIPILIAAIFYKLNEFVTSPLRPGDVLYPGLFRSKCGVLSVLPESITNCEPALVKMGTDGVLTMYRGGEVVWEMKGGVCKEDDETCVPGATLGEDGKITIAGTRVKHTGTKNELVNPWPFDTEGASGDGGWFF